VLYNRSTPRLPQLWDGDEPENLAPGVSARGLQRRAPLQLRVASSAGFSYGDSPALREKHIGGKLEGPMASGDRAEHERDKLRDELDWRENHARSRQDLLLTDGLIIALCACLTIAGVLLAWLLLRSTALQ
jgi:hypothetical protein